LAVRLGATTSTRCGIWSGNGWRRPRGGSRRSGCYRRRGRRVMPGRPGTFAGWSPRPRVSGDKVTTAAAVRGVDTRGDAGRNPARRLAAQARLPQQHYGRHHRGRRRAPAVHHAARRTDRLGAGRPLRSPMRSPRSTVTSSTSTPSSPLGSSSTRRRRSRSACPDSAPYWPQRSWPTSAGTWTGSTPSTDSPRSPGWHRCPTTPAGSAATFTGPVASTDGCCAPAISPHCPASRTAQPPAPSTTGNDENESPTSKPSSPSPEDGSTSSGPCSATTPPTKNQLPPPLDNSIEIPSAPAGSGPRAGRAAGGS
jgi:hypothetical protein